MEFYDLSTNEIRYYFPAPFMTDNEGKVSYDVFYELVEPRQENILTGTTDGAEGLDTLYLKLILDKEWLSEASYPVTVDPVLKQCRAKNLLDSGCVGSDNTVRNELYVGRNNVGLFRSYVKFALPELPKQCIVTEALLNLGGEEEEDNG